MRKQQRAELAIAEFRANIGPCDVHGLLFERHLLDEDGEGCWDCPVQGCLNHVHEYPVPWWAPYAPTSYVPVVVK